MEARVARHFEDQARACDDLGSPFTAGLCRLLADRLHDECAFGRRIGAWQGDLRAEALSLRACGALNALARSGEVPELTAAYPPAVFDAERLWAGIATALRGHDAWLAGWLDSPPQTNEVARSAFILGGALMAARLTGLPLALLELGASAGLNLFFDEYRYELGEGRVWGADHAGVRIASDWRGEVPSLRTPLRVVGRKACDRNPLDPGSAGDAGRLTAYVWADQTHRLERLEAALRHAAAAPVRVDRADAGEWVERRLAEPPEPGVCRFLFHTIMWSYLDSATKAQIGAAVERAGAEATSEAPLAHFSVESDGQDPGALMALRVWPGGELRTLGRADYHGRWVDWA